MLKLVSMKPREYSKKLNLAEKLGLFTVLINGVHEQTEFRAFLNARVEEKSAYNKQKMDIIV